MDDPMLNSRPFEFIVQGESFFVHAALIAKVSKPLERFINGGMSEAKLGQGGFKDEDQATFARFCHWAYAGFYHAEKFSERPENDTAKVDETDSESISPPPSYPIPTPRKVKKSALTYGESLEPVSKQEALKLAFLSLRYCTAAEERSTWVPRANNGPMEDYKDQFLSHARLYVFAEKFDIQTLKRLVLKNLHQTLTLFTLWPDCIGDIVALISFVYDNTIPTRNGDEPMREMLSQYIGYEMHKLTDAAAFRELLDKNRDILDDFCSQVGRRI